MADEVLAPDPRYYPKAKYCIDGSNRVVADSRAEASLDPSQWFDNPNQAKEAAQLPKFVAAYSPDVKMPIRESNLERPDSDESWQASEALLQPKRRGRPPKVHEVEA